MKDKKEIDYYEVLTELADCIQTSIELKKRNLEYLIMGNIRGFINA